MLYEYDATNEKCPVPLVNLKLILRKLTPGDNCMMRICDKGSKKDIPKLLTKIGVQFEMRNVDDVMELTITMENKT